MFISATSFEKLLKNAYKDNRLHIGNDGENFLAAGAGWQISMVTYLMPKEYRAAVIKYCDYMPDPGEYFLVLPEGKQSEVEGSMVYKGSTEGMESAEITRLIYARNEKILLCIFQSLDDGRAYMTRKDLVDMIDYRYIDDADGELEVSGPFIDSQQRHLIIENDRMQMSMCMWGPDDAEAELLEFLSGRDLNSFGKEEEE